MNPTSKTPPQIETAASLSEQQQTNLELALSRFSAAKVVLADLDGCLATANIPLPGAGALAEFLGDRLYIVSNNSRDLAQSLSDQLRRQDMVVPEDRILLAGHLMVELVAQQSPGARIQLFGSDSLADLAEDLGLKRTEQDPEILLLSRDTAFSYEKLQMISRSLARGARLVVANPDLTHPGADGVPVPETGALLAAVRAVAPQLTNDSVQIIGKPEPAIYLAALARAGGIDPAHAVMLGDNPLTDVAGATALGMPAILLGSHPDALINGVAALLPR